MKNIKQRIKHTKWIFFALFLGFYSVNNGYTEPKCVEIKKNEQGGYTLYVEQKPFFSKGIIYNPTPTGKGPGYNFFTHRPKAWTQVDGKLMADLGINAVRVYSTGDNIEAIKEFIDDLYQKYGIYTAVSDWLGLWEQPRANYADPAFRKATKERILRIVKELKDQKGVLMWILGNEIAAEIKKIDPNHPVALGNGESSFLDIAAENCPNIDLLAIIIYRGRTFGNIFENIRNIFDKPIILSEFGCDSYDAYRKKENQNIQSEFILDQWKKIYNNSTVSGNQAGNVLGGFLFEWTDEWWKFNEGYPEGWSEHNPEAGWSNGSYYYDIRAKHNLNMNEEWFGIISLQRRQENDLNKRVPKKAYFNLKEYFQKIEERRVLPAKNE
jgi:hypothetical protein